MLTPRRIRLRFRRAKVLPRLVLENQAHNFFVGSRHRPISEHQDSIFISSLVHAGASLPTWPTTYIVVFVDLEQNDEVGLHEFERVELDFAK